MEAIILAGGRGSRLKSAVWKVPKPLAPIHGKPFLEYLLYSLSERGVTDFIISIGYRKELFKKAFKDSKYNIRWSSEDLPLGTGGAVKKALGMTLGTHVLVVNGDTMFEVGMEPLYKERYHKTIIAVVAFRFHPFYMMNSGTYLFPVSLRRYLKYGRPFEDIFLAHTPILYSSNAPLIDIGTPENYLRAQQVFRKLE